MLYVTCNGKKKQKNYTLPLILYFIYAVNVESKGLNFEAGGLTNKAARHSVRVNTSGTLPEL